MKYISQELKQFSKQIKFAVDNYKPHGIDKSKLSNIVICGMGGSGIAGRIAKGYFNDKLDLPVEIVNDYVLPRYTGPKTLAIFCSYSGNTEETIAAYKIAQEKGCQIIVITCGGEIEKLAQHNEHLIYKVESGLQPRMALGSPLTYLFLIFFDLLGQYKNADLQKIVDFVVNSDDYVLQTGEMVNKYISTIKNKYVIITDSFFEGVATRFAQQIQENAKLEAFVHVLPEANHNAIESYYSKPGTNFIFLNSRNNHRTNLRFAFVKELLTKFDVPMMELLVKDNSLNTLFHIIYQLDWLSLQVADKADAVSNQIPNINSLKEFLSKQ
ncbi:SIS domain-containing protein [Solitalea canadensis]|uniref:Glutamine--fructose-6-phosphate aminotransferase [isomerizing] n=1 Tax=Solitalea canadensis (strain ATCC 29591 / DSM 3403 / JCM 21819 / LMG 8368 / NBRC 15130 / NCIMB 12057 / USAM 9D) TaxID=929556 RepID=H8KMA9_SOLCM|nr:SIS domain-containing protein [Solitalea canadensis]AFD09291.1 putative phosphosugar isomerase [Solitalea canadensis DSM 3403]